MDEILMTFEFQSYFSQILTRIFYAYFLQYLLLFCRGSIIILSVYKDPRHYIL
jgi:hypothetical protein